MQCITSSFTVGNTPFVISPTYGPVHLHKQSQRSAIQPCCTHLPSKPSNNSEDYTTLISIISIYCVKLHEVQRYRGVEGLLSGCQIRACPLIPAQCTLHVGVMCAVNTGAETNTWMCPGVGDSRCVWVTTAAATDCQYRTPDSVYYVVELCWAIECSQTIQTIQTRQTLHNRHNTSTHCLHTLTSVEADM